MKTKEEKEVTAEVKYVVKKLTRFVQSLHEDKEVAFVEFHEDLMNCYINLADQVSFYGDGHNKDNSWDATACTTMLFLIGRVLMATHPAKAKGRSAEECLTDACVELNDHYGGLDSDSFYETVSTSFKIAADIYFSIDQAYGLVFLSHFYFSLR